MKHDIEKLKDFVTRNETYLQTANWLIKEIAIANQQMDSFMLTGQLPPGISTEQHFLSKLTELDRRSAVEERVFAELQREQIEFTA
tara:strand:+ start:170 stop:427 length:258 start_codon:yes stop_codon:yes gene_type:complete